MRMRCINDLLKAANGAISKAEAEVIFDSIETRINRPYPPREEANTPTTVREYRKKFLALSPEDQTKEAARVAFADSVFEKWRAVQNRQALIEKLADGKMRISIDPGGQMKGLINDLVGRPDGTQKELSFQAREKGIAKIYLGKLMPALDQYMGKIGWKFSKADEEAVTRALYGEKVDNPHAMELAETVRAINEDVRQRKNRAGICNAITVRTSGTQI